MPTDAIIQLPTDGAGKKVDADSLTVGANTVYRERDRIAGTAAAEIAEVRNADAALADYALAVRPIPPAAINPVKDYQASLAVAAGATATLTSSSADGKKLTGVDIWSVVAFKVLIHTVDNGTQSTTPVAVGGAQAYAPFLWRTPSRGYVSLGSNAGLDAFRALVTNLDPANAADVLAVFHYED